MFWKNFLTWLLKFTLERLGADVDAESKKLLADYERRRAETEKAREESEIELGRIEHERLTLIAKRVKSSSEVEFVQKQVEHLDAKLQKLKDEKLKKVSGINNLTDDDLLRLNL